MEERGFELVETGSWEDIVSFCKQLSPVLKEQVPSADQERFEAWRPKSAESKRVLREKTAKEAAINETGIESASDGPAAEVSHAGADVKQGGKDMVHGKPRDSIHNVEDAGSSVLKAFMPPLLRMFRVVEKLLYTNVMGKTNPNYFESKAFTVGIERELLDRTTYQVRVICDDESLFETVKTAMDGE